MKRKLQSPRIYADLITNCARVAHKLYSNPGCRELLNKLIRQLEDLKINLPYEHITLLSISKDDRISQRPIAELLWYGSALLTLTDKCFACLQTQIMEMLLRFATCNPSIRSHLVQETTLCQSLYNNIDKNLAVQPTDKDIVALNFKLLSVLTFDDHLSITSDWIMPLVKLIMNIELTKEKLSSYAEYVFVTLNNLCTKFVALQSQLRRHKSYNLYCNHVIMFFECFESSLSLICAVSLSDYFDDKLRNEVWSNENFLKVIQTIFNLAAFSTRESQDNNFQNPLNKSLVQMTTLRLWQRVIDLRMYNAKEGTSQLEPLTRNDVEASRNVETALNYEHIEYCLHQLVALLSEQPLYSFLVDELYTCLLRTAFVDRRFASMIARYLMTPANITDNAPIASVVDTALYGSWTSSRSGTQYINKSDDVDGEELLSNNWTQRVALSAAQLVALSIAFAADSVDKSLPSEQQRRRPLADVLDQNKLLELIDLCLNVSVSPTDPLVCVRARLVVIGLQIATAALSFDEHVGANLVAHLEPELIEQIVQHMCHSNTIADLNNISLVSPRLDFILHEMMFEIIALLAQCRLIDNELFDGYYRNILGDERLLFILTLALTSTDSNLITLAVRTVNRCINFDSDFPVERLASLVSKRNRLNDARLRINQKHPLKSSTD